MTPWQRRLRFGLGLFIPLFALVVFFSVRKPHNAPSPPKVATRDPNAVVQSVKGRVTSASGSRQYFIDYDELLTYQNGAMKMKGAHISVPQRAGRDFKVAAKEAEQNGDQSLVTLRGDVRLASSDGLALDTQEATYANGEGLVRAPKAVAFTKGAMVGSSVGMTYDKNRDVLNLLNNVAIHMKPGQEGGEEADVKAGAAEFVRPSKYIRLTGGATVVRGGQTLEGQEILAYLTEDEQHVQSLELRGSSKVAGSNVTAGGLRSMTAADINLGYAPEGQTLEHALLSGNASIDLAGDTPADAGRRLSAQWVDITLGKDGSTVTHLVGRQDVVLDLPASKETPTRRVKSDLLDGSGVEPQGLTAATFSGRVDFIETPAAPAKPRVARASVMTLALKGGFNSIESAQFGGGVRFEQDELAATARDARYVLTSGQLSLNGADEKTGRPPQVMDSHVTIEARRIDITLDSKKITAAENVKSNLKPSKGADRGSGGKATKMPSMLKQDQPVSATSDNLAYDSDTSHAVYTGHAQLWQGDTAIKADTITLDDQTGNLSASGSVVSKMTLQHTDEQTKKRESNPSVITAKEMVYQDDARRATYTGSAHMNGPQGDLTGDKLEIFLSADGNDVERIEGYGTLSLKTPEGRKATGSRLTYYAADERYVMTGTPVKIVEECRETTGKSLTFFKSADRIIVDGNEQKRTEWKGASNCSPGPRID